MHERVDDTDRNTILSYQNIVIIFYTALTIWLKTDYIIRKTCGCKLLYEVTSVTG